MVAANSLKPVHVNGASVIVDCGAYGDRIRVSFQKALDRQFAFEERNRFIADAFVGYDLLIDEKWGVDGVRRKCRWSAEEAALAVIETIRAAQFFAKTDIAPRKKVFSVQGVSALQQIRCAEEILPLMNPRHDILGLGGWCVIGLAAPNTNKRSTLERQFWNTIWAVIPKAAAIGVGHIHIFGVMVPEILGGLRWICDLFGVPIVSTDSSGPHTLPGKYGRWGYGNWKRKCHFPPGKERGLARVAHVKAVRGWLRNFRETIYYVRPPKPF